LGNPFVQEPHLQHELRACSAVAAIKCPPQYILDENIKIFIWMKYGNKIAKNSLGSHYICTF
jgi:hypothetical protein